MRKFYWIIYLLLIIFNLVSTDFYAQQSVDINLSIEYQTIRGFGGMNHPIWIDDLNEDEREKLFPGNWV